MKNSTSDGRSKCLSQQSFIFNSELLDRQERIQCSRCMNEALLRCERTNFFFCSIKCSLLSQETVIADAPLNKNEVKRGESIKKNDQVVIMGIINEKCLYVKRTNCDDMMNDIHKFSKQAPALENFPEVGDLVLVRYHDQIYRAKVLEVSDDDDYSITVQLIDFGNTAQIFLNDLMAISEACQRIECVTHKVLLKDVNIDAINQDIVDYLTTLLEEKTELTVKQIEGSLVVLGDKSVNINEKILALAVINEASYSSGAGALLDVSFYF